MHSKKLKAFSLMEVIITLVIIGILVAVLTPAYNSYITKSQRSDAIKSIANLQVLEEKYRLNNTSYGSLAQLGATSASLSGYYTMGISNVTASSYTITATAGSEQSSDTGCTTMSIAYANGTSTKNVPNCWQ